ncbi:MAG: HAD-IA family hydrolase [Pseudomonadota bacterium]
MSGPRRLVVFDVDGTLVDSQNDIVAAMSQAFVSEGLTAPARSEVLGIVGLSLDVALPRLAPDASAAAHQRMVEGYKAAYMALRAQAGVETSSPLYPGAREVLAALGQRPDIVLGVATGKSRRGLDKLIAGHRLEGVFTTQQVADFHPSKPHPAMLHAALEETGVAPEHAVMVGDTSFDMEMAAAAGMAGIGVSWGYHPVEQLKAARRVIARFEALAEALDEIWRVRA